MDSTSGAYAPDPTSGEGPSTTRSSSNPEGLQPAPPNQYESQKLRDWNTFLQFLKNHKTPLTLAKCGSAQVIEFLKYLDKFGKTKVHISRCLYFGLLRWVLGLLRWICYMVSAIVMKRKMEMAAKNKEATTTKDLLARMLEVEDKNGELMNEFEISQNIMGLLIANYDNAWVK